MRKLGVIATLNQHLLTPQALQSLHEHGATIFRINGSHVQQGELKRYTTAIRKTLGDRIRILVDLPGNKVRTGILLQPILLKAGTTFDLASSQINYPGFISRLQQGDILFANDSLFKFRVESVSPEVATLHSFTDGTLISNKGIHLPGRELNLPFLFDRDRALIQQAIENGLDYIGLSFVRTPEDVREALGLISGTRLQAIVKVETRLAVENLDAILDAADEFLVDRGDLSCEVGVENIEIYQKYILRKAKEKGKKIFFATQFLHSMTQANVPLIAESTAVADAICSGIDGLQLSEETATGSYPLEVLQTVQKIHEACQHGLKLTSGGRSAPVLWFTGRSGAGKTTLARQLVDLAWKKGLRPAWIDGDEFRDFWKGELGFSRADRVQNQKNMIYSAWQASMHFDLVIVSSLSPFAELRAMAREKIPSFHEIFIDCPIDVCRQRDPKGLYKQGKPGGSGMIDAGGDGYEAPTSPELTIATDGTSQAEAFQRLASYVFDRFSSR